MSDTPRTRWSLGEWFTAIGQSTLGDPLNISSMPGGEPFTISWLGGPTIRLWPFRVATPGAAIALLREYRRFGLLPEDHDCRTPDELRAEIDRIAAKAQYERERRRLAAEALYGEGEEVEI